MALTNAQKSEEVINALLGEFFVMVQGHYLEPVEGYDLQALYRAQATFGNWMPAKLVNGVVEHIFTAAAAAQIDCWFIGRREASSTGIISGVCKHSLQHTLSKGQSIHVSFKPELTVD
jgi:hypothetical protein